MELTIATSTEMHSERQRRKLKKGIRNVWKNRKLKRSLSRQNQLVLFNKLKMNKLAMWKKILTMQVLSF
jgi:hypothetical protein